jgi:hypothetical protein
MLKPAHFEVPHCLLLLLLISMLRVVRIICFICKARLLLLQRTQPTKLTTTLLLLLLPWHTKLATWHAKASIHWRRLWWLRGSSECVAGSARWHCPSSNSRHWPSWQLQLHTR